MRARRWCAPAAKPLRLFREEIGETCEEPRSGKGVGGSEAPGADHGDVVDVRAEGNTTYADCDGCSDCVVGGDVSQIHEHENRKPAIETGLDCSRIAPHLEGEAGGRNGAFNASAVHQIGPNQSNAAPPDAPGPIGARRHGTAH